MITAHIDFPLSTIDTPLVRRGEEHWRQRAGETGDPALARFAAEALASAALGGLLRAAFAYSPFLTQELTGQIPFVRDLAGNGFERTFDEIIAALQALPADTMATAEVMRALRKAKRRAALLIALADISGAW